MAMRGGRDVTKIEFAGRWRVERAEPHKSEAETEPAHVARDARSGDCSSRGRTL
jgi:hypothetical protein